MSSGREFYVARKKRAKAAVGGLFVSTGSRIHRKAVVDRCRVPTPEGPCGHPFFEDESQSKREAHLVDCCRRNTDTIMAERERQHPAIMEPWDTELDRWIAQHRREIIEGRKRI